MIDLTKSIKTSITIHSDVTRSGITSRKTGNYDLFQNNGDKMLFEYNIYQEEDEAAILILTVSTE